MRKCQAVSSGMSPALNVVAVTTSHGMTTGEPFVLAVTTTNAQPTPPCDIWATRPKTIGEVVSQYQMTLEPSMDKQQSSGSAVMEWTYQQLSETDWSGAQAGSNSSSSLVIAGKPGTSGNGGSKSSASATPAGMLTNASTSTDDSYTRQWRHEEEMRMVTRLL